MQSLAEASALDEGTRSLVYLAVLAALGLESGRPFLVRATHEAGATEDEVVSVILLELPAAGTRVIKSLLAAIKYF